MTGTTGGYFTIPHDLARRLHAHGGVWEQGAFTWLADRALACQTAVPVGRKLLKLGPGQLCTTLRDLARAWECSIGRVQR